MILYLDSSGLVKLFLDEADCALARLRFQEAEIAVTSRVAYVETMAAFGRRNRDGGVDALLLEKLVSDLDRVWSDLFVLDIDEKIAGQLAIKHGLRGFDAVHVAAALRIRRIRPNADIQFLSFDSRQNAAAWSEGLILSTVG